MRYAIYFVPEPETELARFGLAWLGRDMESGNAVPWPSGLGIPSERIEAITAEPRRYGFHATLKPPVHLRNGETEDALLESLTQFVQSRTSGWWGIRQPSCRRSPLRQHAPALCHRGWQRHGLVSGSRRRSPRGGERHSACWIQCAKMCPCLREDLRQGHSRDATIFEN